MGPEAGSEHATSSHGSQTAIISLCLTSRVLVVHCLLDSKRSGVGCDDMQSGVDMFGNLAGSERAGGGRVSAWW